MKKVFCVLLLSLLVECSFGQHRFSFDLSLEEYKAQISFPGRPTVLTNPNTYEPAYTYQDQSSTFLFQISKGGSALREEPDIYKYADVIIESFLLGFKARSTSKTLRYYKNVKCVDFSFKNDRIEGMARCLIYNKYIFAIVYFSTNFSSSDYTLYFQSLKFL